MKKVKTLIISLLIAFASSFMTACSCNTGSEGSVVQVLEQSIAIDCTSNNVDVVKDAETGYLTIRCYKGSSFTINYTLAPDNVTTTRVNWNYKGADDILSCDRNTYSQTSSEPVTFIARNVGNTIIEFESDATKKTTQATVIVGDVPEALPTFVSVDVNTFDYNKNTQELSWGAVSHVITKTGEVVSSTQAGVLPPTGYEVRIFDITNDKALDTVFTASTKITLARGVEYSVQIIAKGDFYTVKDSELSGAFKFCQLETVKELKHNNGEVSFIAPKFSTNNDVTLWSGKVVPVTSGNYIDPVKVNLNTGANKQNSYEISVVSYPDGYIANKGYASPSNNIRYYPSVASEKLIVNRLASPEIFIVNDNSQKTEQVSVQANKVNISGEIEKSVIYFKSDLNVEGIEYQYGYAIYKGETKFWPEGNVAYAIANPTIYNDTTGCGLFDTSVLWGKNLTGDCTIKVYTIPYAKHQNAESTLKVQNTIPSDVVEFNLTVLRPIESSSINENKLTINDANDKIYALQLLFVNEQGETVKECSVESYNKNDEKYEVNVGSIDLAALGLPAGSYDIYGKYIGIDQEGVKNGNFSKITLSSQLAKLNSDMLIVNQTTTSVSVNNKGDISFAAVPNADNYNVRINRYDSDNSIKDTKTVPIGNTTSVNLFDIIEDKYLVEDGVYYSLKISIITTSEDGIDSAKSKELEVQKIEKIDVNKITLEDYKINFDTVHKGNDQFYYIIKAGSIEKSILNNGSLDLSSERNNISKTNPTEVSIRVEPSTTETSDGFVWLDSEEVKTTFVPTVKPTNLSLNASGVLTFNTKYVLGERNFVVLLNGTKTEENYKYTQDKIDDATAETDVEITLDLLNDLKSLAGQNVTISVYEIDSAKFDGEASENFYTYILSGKAITKVVTEVDKKEGIQFTADDNEGVVYKLLVDETEVDSSFVKAGEVIKLEDILPKTDGKIATGTYKIKLQLTYTNNGVNSEENPFVIVDETLSTTTCEVTVKSKAITTNPIVDNCVEWTAIEGITKYTVKLDGVVREENNTTLTHSLLDATIDAGSHTLVISPVVNYVEDGIYLVDDEKENSVTKLSTPANFATSEGDITFSVSKIDGEYKFNIKVNGTPLNEGEYKLSAPVDGENNTSIYTISELDKKFKDTIEISIQVTSTGCLESEYNTAVGYTRLSMASVNKVGNKILWTPDGNAYKFTIEIGEMSYELKLEGNVCKVLNTSSGEYESNENFGYYDENKTILFFVFDESSVVGINAGVYNIRVQQFTEASGCVNSAMSDPYGVTKLSNDIAISADSSEDSDSLSRIEVKAYKPVDGGEAPVKFQYIIQRYTVEQPGTDQTQTVDEGSDDGSGEGATDGESGETTTPVTKVEKSVVSDILNYSEYFTTPESKMYINLDEIGLTDAGTYRVFIVFYGDGVAYTLKTEDGDIEGLTYDDVKGEVKVIRDDTEFNNKILNSEIKEIKELIKLPATQIKTTNGVLQLGDNASKSANTKTYTLSIRTGNQEDNQATLIEGLTFDSTDGSVVSVIDKFDFAPGILYYVKARSVSENYISSTWSEEFRVMKLSVPTVSDVINRANTPFIKVTDANAHITNLSVLYQLSYDAGANFEEATGKSENSSFEGYELATDKPLGDYNVVVRALGTTATTGVGLLTSDNSTVKTIRYIANTTNPTIVNGGLNWTSMGNAIYKITIGGKETYTSDNKYSFLESDLVESGKQDIKIDVIKKYQLKDDQQQNQGDGTVVPETNQVTEIISTLNGVEHKNTTSIYIAKSIDNFKVINGDLSWSIKYETINDFVTANKEALGFGSLDDDILTKAVVEYIKTEVNPKTPVATVEEGGEEGSDSSIDLTAIKESLSFLHTFNMEINGIQTTVTADSVTDDTVNEMLVFSYIPKLSAEVYEEVVSQQASGSDTTNLTNPVGTMPGKYDLRIASKGNTLKFVTGDDTATQQNATTNKVAVASSKYTNELTVYKPTTPISWNEEGSNRGIVNGNFLWRLVTNADSTLNNGGEWDYHDKYMLTAYPENSNNKEGSKVTIDVDGESDDISIISDKYTKAVKDIFKTENSTVVVEPNKNYNVTISVVGTADSDTVGSDKIYLNSDAYLFPNVMNILKNVGGGVTSSTFNWSESTGSTKTIVKIYGPFKYAPIDLSDEEVESYIETNINANTSNGQILNNADNKEDVARKLILKDWLNGNYGDSSYDSAREYPNISWTDIIDDVEGQETDPLKPQVKTITIPKDQTRSISISEEIQNYIEREGGFGAGGYIIRKQEIGDGFGVVDTDANFDDLDLFGSNGSHVDYEFFANKLDKVTAVNGSWIGQTAFDVTTTANGTATQGMFVWNKVPYANAYKVILRGYKAGETESKVYKEYIEVDNNENSFMTFDLRDNPLGLNNSDIDSIVSYDIVVTALNVNITYDENGNPTYTIRDGYFIGDPVKSAKHNRVIYDDNLTISNTGLIKWSDTTSNDKAGYIIKVNSNDGYSKLYFVGSSVTNDSIIADLGALTHCNTFTISIKAIGLNGYINSSYSEQVYIVRYESPSPSVKAGEVSWGKYTSSAGGNPTKTNLEINNVDNDGNVIKNIFTGSVDSDVINYNIDSDEYTAKNKYSFTIQYEGNKDDTFVPGETYYIVSNPVTLTVTKLETPSIAIYPNSSGENKVYWSAIDNASGYRVVISQTTNEFSTILYVKDEAQTCLEVVTEGETTLAILDVNELLTIAGESIKFDPTKTESGIKIKVQAIGTKEDKEDNSVDLFANSSYSNELDYSTPKKAHSGVFDRTTGTVSWSVVEADNKGKSVLLTTTYTVSNVSDGDWKNYWNSSNKAKILEALGITQREIIIDGNVVNIESSTANPGAFTVRDWINLNVGIDEPTPTSYQLTNIGANYVFTIKLISDYASSDYEFGYKEGSDNPYTFDVFSGGDGSEYLPYKVSTVDNFNNINKFANRSFILINNITLSNIKNPMNAFSGMIDGNGKTITVSNDSEYEINNEDNRYSLTLFKEISEGGIIKNLNIKVSYAISGTGYSATTLKAAGLAETNSGKIDNVHISGYIYVSTDNYHINIGGIVVNNLGTISNSSFNGDEKYQTYKGLYGHTYSIAMIGGISVSNEGLIKDCCVDGQMLGNMLGGITYHNYGTVDRSYTKDTAEITIQNFSAEEKGISYGGIVGRLYKGAKITNSYATAKVIIYCNNANGTVGGLVDSLGYDEKYEDRENATVSNCYVVLRMEFEQSNGSVVAHKFMNSSDSVTFENNYFVSEEFSNYVGESIENNISSGLISLNALDDLKNALDTDSSTDIYEVINGETYPVLKAEVNN